MESSGPNSGTTTTEMLSPVRDVDNKQYCATEVDVHHLQEIGNQYSQVIVPLDIEGKDVKENLKTIEEVNKEHASGLNLPLENTTANLLNNAKENNGVPKQPPKMERRISRFKVSVVTEPDQSKLQVPDVEKPEEKTSKDEKDKVDPEIDTIINRTFNILEKDITASYSHRKGNSIRTLNLIIWRDMI